MSLLFLEKDAYIRFWDCVTRGWKDKLHETRPFLTFWKIQNFPIKNHQLVGNLSIDDLLFKGKTTNDTNPEIFNGKIISFQAERPNAPRLLSFPFSGSIVNKYSLHNLNARDTPEPSGPPSLVPPRELKILQPSGAQCSTCQHQFARKNLDRAEVTEPRLMGLPHLHWPFCFCQAASPQLAADW